MDWITEGNNASVDMDIFRRNGKRGHDTKEKQLKHQYLRLRLVAFHSHSRFVPCVASQL